eukprot:gene56666-biopygen117700
MGGPSLPFQNSNVCLCVVPSSVDMGAEFAMQQNGVFDVSMNMMQPEVYQPSHATHFWFTAPVYMSDVGALVLTTRVETGLWRLFGPFAIELWGATVGCTFALAAVLILISAISPPVGGDTWAALSWKGIATSVYHAWAFLMGGEDFEWLNWPGRCMRLTFLFLVLILAATYTANLAAFFTAPAYQVH